jgi:hypothetical protein
MHKSPWFSILAVLLLLSAAGAGLRVRAQEQETPNHEERAKAVNIVRLLNTAEVMYNSQKAQTDGAGRFCSWDELYSSGILKATQNRFRTMNNVELSAGPEIIPGYRLDIVVSADGQFYSIALHDKKEGDRLFSVFSDQTGIIFLGAPLQ